GFCHHRHRSFAIQRSGGIGWLVSFGRFTRFVKGCGWRRCFCFLCFALRLSGCGGGVCGVRRKSGSSRGNSNLLRFHRCIAFADLGVVALCIVVDLVAIGIALTVTAVAATTLAARTAARTIATFWRILILL